MSSNRILQQPVSQLKFKNLSKKSANFYNNCEYNEILDSSFLGGIQACTKGILTFRHINLFVLMLRRSIGKGRFNWNRIHVCFNFRFHKTQKSSGHRMGHGKGKRMIWSHVILPGEIFLKVLPHSKKFIFLDSFSWTFLFNYFDYYLEVYWLGISNLKYQSRKEIYNYSFVLTKFSKFLRINFRSLYDLRVITNMKRFLAFQSISSSLLFYYNFLIKLLSNSIYNKIYSKFFTSKTNSNYLLIIMLHLILHFSLRLFVDINTARFFFLKSIKSEQYSSLMFNLHVSKFWFFGLLQYFLYSSNESIKYGINHHHYIINIPFFYYSITKIFKFLRFFVNQGKKQNDNNNSLNYPYQYNFLHFVKNSYHNRNKKRILFYPKRNKTFPFSVLCTLNRIRFKTPFKSRIIFMDSTKNIFFNEWSSVLRHKSFNPMKKKKKRN